MIHKEIKMALKKTLMGLFIVSVIIFMHAPIIALMVSSFSTDIHFSLPFAGLTTEWYVAVFHSGQIRSVVWNTFSTALVVMVPATIIGLMAALAFAKYKWRSRGVYQKILLLPIFFSQMVLGLALLLMSNQIGIIPSWITAAISHLVWILPVVTIVIAIQVYGYDKTLDEAAYDLAATPIQVFREVTLPILMFGIFSGAVFAFLLSWSNYDLSLFLQGVDQMLPVYIIGKMSGGYSPMAPALSVVIYLLSGVILFLPMWLMQRIAK